MTDTKLAVQSPSDVVEMTISLLRNMVRLRPEVLYDTDVEAFITGQLELTLVALREWSQGSSKMVMVPNEPTENMIRAGVRAWAKMYPRSPMDDFRNVYINIYRAMLAAAPQPEEKK
jgi:hypothetical protein